MKFGKEFASQVVQEWQEAYMDYNLLKKILKDILNFRRRNASSPVSVNPKAPLRRRLSLYRAFSGLTSRYNTLINSPRKNNSNEDEVILVSAVQNENSEGHYETMFLMSSEEGGENELLFFRRLDTEFNKVLQFYKTKVEEVKSEAEELSRQMDALIALRIKVDDPVVELKAANGINASRRTRASSSNSIVLSHGGRNEGTSRMDAIKEVELNGGEIVEDESRTENESKSYYRRKKSEGKTEDEGAMLAQLKVLDHIKINVESETPVSTLKNILNSTSDLSFNKEELKKAEERMKQALVEFHRKLRLLKSYSFLNLLAFSKIMKKYDKITARNASKSYLEMVDKSYLGSSDEINKLTERVEATFIKHFSNGNRRQGMKLLRPRARKERHRVTFFLGLFSGCSLALVLGIIISIHARDLLRSDGRDQYMNNIFPLYSLFGYIVLHMLLYSGNIYFWRRYRVNYPFIFGFKQGTELGYREVLLLASGLSVLALAAALSNLDMDMDPITKEYKALIELVPLGLVTVVLLILFCPFNIIYRSSRFFLIRCTWHCLLAPLYKVTFSDFFLADQLTSQVQAFRSFQFYVCYYGWGDYKKRSNRCQGSDIYDIFYIIVAVVPYWSRFLQCLRRMFGERNSMQGLNALKYLSTIVAVVMRTIYDLKRGTFWKIIAASTSGVTTVYSTYWDIVIDWGLLRRNSKNPWLRDKLLLTNKPVYFVAMVINVILRLVWMQLVLDFQETPFLHRKAFVAVVACLEILRRGIWNFFRMENEHLNNVENYRAFKSVPLPFYYDEDKSV